MSVFEAIYLMLAFGTLLIAIISYLDNRDKK